jgi:hypothetical protein
MSPIVLLARLHRVGLRLRADDAGYLIVGPKSKITGELRLLIQAHKLALLDMIEGNPSRDELGLVTAVLEHVELDDITVRPVGPRSIGSHARCPRDPDVGTWVSIGGRPACRRCELGLAPEPALGEPPALSAWFIRHCQGRGLQSLASRPKRLEAPLTAQIWACLASGPKSVRQVALELDVPADEIRRVLGGRAIVERDGGLRMTAFPDEDEGAC